MPLLQSLFLPLPLSCFSNQQILRNLFFMQSLTPPSHTYVSSIPHTFSLYTISASPSLRLSLELLCSTTSSSMADRQQPPHQLQVHPQRHYQDVGMKGLIPEKGPSTSKVLAVVTLLPVGGTLLLLSGLTLAGTLLGLAITTPLFIIFSPVLVPAALTIGLAVTAFLTSGVFGLTACSSLAWVFGYLRRAAGAMPEQLEQAKKHIQEMAGYAGQKTKEFGQEIQGKAQDQPGRRT